VWKDTSLARMTPESRDLWLKLFDPSANLANARLPVFFVNGTTDFAYPLDSYQKTYRLVPERWRNVSVVINRPHGHIWNFPEVDLFVDSVLRKSQPLVRIGRPVVRENHFAASIDRTNSLKQFFLSYTTNSGPWQKRVWHEAPARLDGQQLSAELPSTRPLVAFLVTTDELGARVSSEHVMLE
jgi:hypothetical protein